MAEARRPKNPTELTNLAAILKEERINARMTQEQTARQFGISLKSLRNLEQGLGGVTLATAAKILSFFGKELRVGDIVLSPRLQTTSRPRKEKILEILGLAEPILIKKFHVKKLILFGSVARDEATKKSDIDIAVRFDTEPDFELIGRLVAFLETLFEGPKVDLVEEGKLIPQIKKSAKKDMIHVI